jgi:predicted nuclease of predicted toxin-antitoxin system
MKLLLDAHISGRVVAKALIKKGHDARSMDSESELEGLPDEGVLELSASEGRVLVTANVKDFDPLLTQWSGEGRSHAGVVLIPSSVRNEDFGALISGIEETLEAADQGEWTNRVEWLKKR